MTRDSDALAFLQDGGAMGELIRGRDWRDSELGAPEQWPDALKTVMSGVLSSGTAMHISWGENLLQFYNDAYTPVLTGDQHPAALGSSEQDRLLRLLHCDELQGFLCGRPVPFEDFRAIYLGPKTE